MGIPLAARIFKALFRLLVLFLVGRIGYARYLGVQVGAGCRLYISDWGSEPFLIKIGNRVTITSGVKLLTHDGATWLVRNDSGVRYQRYRRICIGDDVFVGIDAIVLPGITIGNRVVVGAGSVVTRDVPDNTVVVGNPAKRVCSFDSYRKKIESSEALDTELVNARSYRQRVELAIRIAAGRQ